MKTRIPMVLLLAACCSPAVAGDQATAVLGCIDAGYSKRIAEQDRAFESQQFSVICQYEDPEKREKNEVFSYVPPDGYRVADARLNVVLKTAHASVGGLSLDAHRATVRLQCRGREDNAGFHDLVAVKILGRLDYVPTLQDAKEIAEACVVEIVRRNAGDR